MIARATAIDPVSCTHMYSQLYDSFANRSTIAEVTRFDVMNAQQNPALGTLVPQTVKPIVEGTISVTLPINNGFDHGPV